MFRVANRRDEVVVLFEIRVRARSRASTSMCDPKICCDGLGSSPGSVILYQDVLYLDCMKKMTLTSHFVKESQDNSRCEQVVI